MRGLKRRSFSRAHHLCARPPIRTRCAVRHQRSAGHTAGRPAAVSYSPSLANQGSGAPAQRTHRPTTSFATQGCRTVCRSSSRLSCCCRRRCYDSALPALILVGHYCCSRVRNGEDPTRLFRAAGVRYPRNNFYRPPTPRAAGD